MSKIMKSGSEVRVLSGPHKGQKGRVENVFGFVVIVYLFEAAKTVSLYKDQVKVI